MIGPLFVDTNVLIYARDAREPRKQQAARTWLEYLWREQLGRTSTQVLNEYYHVVTRKLSPPVEPGEAWEAVEALLAWGPQPIDAELLRRARPIEQRHRLSWWDSLIVGAAQLQGCVALLTEDLQDGAAFGGVTVRNPFTAGITEVQAAYAGAPLAVHHYRRRGRPARCA